MSDDPPPYVPYGSSPAAPAPGGWISPYLADSDGQREALAAKVRERLQTSERLLCVLSVIKIHPSLNMLAITDQRVLAGWRDDLDDDGFRWAVELPGPSIREVEVTGLMDNVKFVDHEGDGTKVGNLRDVSEEKRLREALVVAQGGGTDEPEAPPAAPTWDVYPG